MNLSIQSIVLSLSLTSVAVFAAKPTEINYVSKNKTLMGTEYRVYAVRCSDGKQTTVSLWDKNQWCIHTNTDACFASQIEAATQSCNR